MKLLRLLALGTVAALLVAGCAAPKKPEPAGDRLSLTGTINFRERIALPYDAVLTVRLLDVSRTDAPAIVLAERSVAQPGNPPLPFELRYRPAEAARGHRFVVEARIEVGGRLRFSTVEPHPVKLDGTDGPQTVWVGASAPR